MQSDEMAGTGVALVEGMQRAIAHLHAGDFAAAESSCRVILQANPAQPDALHMLGVIEHLRGRHGDAVRLIDQALSIKPDFAEALYNRGNALGALQRQQEALASFDRALAVRPDFAEALHNRGDVLVALNRLQEGLESYDAALAIKPDYAEALNDRGNTLNALSRPLEALESYDRALSIRSDFVEALYNRGHVLAALNRPQQALASYDRALALRPDFAEALHNRGNALVALNRHEEALASYDRALALRPGFVGVLHKRGIVLVALSRDEEALASFDRALAIKPDFAEGLHDRGHALAALNRLDEAVASYDRALAIKPDFFEALRSRGRALFAANHQQAALESYDRALSVKPDSTEALIERGKILAIANRWRDAIDSYQRALAIDPDNAAARFGLCMAELPVLYADEAEVAERRAAYRERLEALSAEPGGTKTRGDLARIIGINQPFLLAYQGRNDRELQAIYGELVCRIFAERYPAATIAPPPGPGEPVRVGVVSGYFEWHSIWKIPIRGWIGQFDRRRFKVFGYHTGDNSDATTREAAGMCDRFVQGRMSLDRWREAILADAPHVLLYPDIGMDGMSACLAAQRLAPVQCVALGHPNTTGFPTLDYFLSSDLMEPADPEGHYTEELVRLPNISIYYEPVAARPVPLNRADFKMRPASTVFWCGQTFFKYQPQFDWVFAHIAREAGDCQFAFIQARGAGITALFKKRLERAFAEVGLRAEDYCIFLPRLNRHQFIAAIGLCDIVLDSIGWSGFNSTLEGLTNDLPIVTMPGPFMRGRHTTAVLRMMDVTETIAETTDDYVSIAARLARDSSWRMAVKARIVANKHRVYRDRTSIAALEEFLIRATRAGGRETVSR